MNQALSQIQEFEPGIVLRRFGQGFSQQVSDSLELVTTVIDIVENRGVRDIIVCGHSMCAGTLTSEHELQQRSGCQGVERLLQGVRHREATNEQGKERVIRQVNLWENIPTMKRAMASGELMVHGLFYIAESGVFTRYDELTRQFVALFPNYSDAIISKRVFA